ncbi:unnamed protein product [Schistosoma mattheei]|uniref:Uncharacterized protein n=1 Tax=Schistosoma mattheei TaxID=31246 RepID=A0A183P118_9TREM|nr:unnamed protein product [Schistosoma mattheei]
MYLSDTLPDDELQPFFVENSSLIFLVFSDCFFSLEWDVKLKVEVIEDLLYEKNALNIRKRGIRLFLIWYQILGLNATSVCHRLFYNLVPEFGSLIAEYQKREKCDQLKHSHLQARKFSTDTRGQVMQESRSSNVVAPRERVALLTAAALGEDESVNVLISPPKFDNFVV